MSQQGYHEIDTWPLDGAPATPVGANLIVVVSAVNPGNAALAGAGGVKCIGVTAEATNTNGYAAVRQIGTAQIVVGASTVTAGDQVMADASGKATTMTPSAAGAGTLKGRIGIAKTTATTGNLVDVVIMPQELFAA